MNDDAIIVNRPRRPAGLVLLFHGVGASASDLVPIAQLVGHQHPDAMVVSIDAPHASALGQGREWFSVVGVTEANRPERVARALPEFHDTVAHWQQASATTPAGHSATVQHGSCTRVAATGRNGHRDLIPGLGHGIDGRAGGFLLERLASPGQREDGSPGRG